MRIDEIKTLHDLYDYAKWFETHYENRSNSFLMGYEAIDRQFVSLQRKGTLADKKEAPIFLCVFKNDDPSLNELVMREFIFDLDGNLKKIK